MAAIRLYFATGSVVFVVCVYLMYRHSSGRHLIFAGGGLVAIVSIVCVVSIFLHDPYRRLSPFFGSYKGCGDQDVQCIVTELHLLRELLAFLPTHMFGYDLLSAGNGSLNIANIPAWRISHSTIF